MYLNFDAVSDANVGRCDRRGLAVMSLSLPKMRLTDKVMMRRIIAAVRHAAAETGRALGHRPHAEPAARRGAARR